MRTLDDTKAEQILFFEAIYGEETTGLACVSTRKIEERKWIDRYFKWPDEIEKMLSYINEKRAGHDVYACTTLQSERSREKVYAKDAQCLWADLDTCHPSKCNPPPTIQITTSPGRYHGFWPLKVPIPAALASNYSKRIAYDLAIEGADKSGWDVSQVLRVPGTYNYKYGGTFNIDTRYTTNGNNEIIKFDIATFNDLPAYESNEIVPWEDIPDLLPYDDVHEKYFHNLPNHTAERHLSGTEQDDWSAVLFREVADLFNLGATKAEVFAFTKQSKVNKFERDGRNESALWADILRIQQKSQHERTVIVEGDEVPNINPSIDWEDSYVEKYVQWASAKTDAPVEFHSGGAFIALSAVISSNAIIKFKHGPAKLNLWIILLGETSVTRKTTSMSIAMRTIRAVDEDALLGTTEGSAEGMIEALRSRQNMASLYYRDEVAALFKGVRTKQHLSDMLELYTELYDGKTIRRPLRKELITVHDPVFLFFGGGVKAHVFEELTIDHVSSGFVPRSMWIIGRKPEDQSSDVAMADEEDDMQEEEIIQTLEGYQVEVRQTQTIEVFGQEVKQPVEFNVKPTSEALARYNEVNHILEDWAKKRHDADVMVPIMARTAVSTFKMAALIAAARTEPTEDNEIILELQDMDHAIYYTDKWMPSTIEMAKNLGTTANERQIQKVYQRIKDNPGIAHSILSRQFHFSKVEITTIIDTLKDRQMVRAQKAGNGFLYFAESPPDG